VQRLLLAEVVETRQEAFNDHDPDGAIDSSPLSTEGCGVPRSQGCIRLTGTTSKRVALTTSGCLTPR
jgi:hypothetical protein